MGKQFDFSKPSQTVGGKTFDFSKPSQTVSEPLPGIGSTLSYVGEGMGALAKKAADATFGLGSAMLSPIDTAYNISESVAEAVTNPRQTAQGLSRAVRSIPIAGDAINDIVASGKALAGNYQGGPEAGEKARQQHYEEQRAEDFAHEEEHPLTDFLQRSLGLVAIPPSISKQMGAIAIDAFGKSLAAGNDGFVATQDAINAATMVGAVYGVPKAALKTVKKGAGAVGKLIQKDLEISDHALDRYKEAPETINANMKHVKDPEPIRQELNELVAPIRNDLSDAKHAQREALRDVKATQDPPTSLGYEIPEHIGKMSKELFDLSSKSFDILSEEGRTFPFSGLSNAATDVQNSLKIAGVKPTMGPDAKAFGAIDTLKKELKAIAKKFPNAEFPAPIVKEIIQRIDSVSKEAYGLNAGELSPEAAKSLAKIRGSFNQILRKSSPAYADIMDNQLAPKTKMVNEMSPLFGNTEQALLALKTMKNPQSPKGHVFRKMVGEYDKLNGTHFLKQVEDYYDIPRADLIQKERVLGNAKASAEQVSLLHPNRTQKAIRSIQLGNNPEARGQVENLSPELLQTIDDVSVARQLSRPTTNGARRSVAYGAAGAGLGKMIGGNDGAILGAAIGSPIGFILDKFGGAAVRTALDAGIQLDKIANTPYLQVLMDAAKRSPQAAEMYHKLLLQKDENYRKLNE